MTRTAYYFLQQGFRLWHGICGCPEPVEPSWLQLDELFNNELQPLKKNVFNNHPLAVQEA
jgi:hypothetical protein